ncbi:type I-C CRISPR-associated protein Cas5c [Thiothrix fructosivorans]|uniref:pre-crRNA processing endonuclease n=1 Tax=Thiothrix fructosivorans TaxID=111770 RepID=A0A8B0SGI2_9GAMM|nr:type I-C CRISPR-associated protein Cas5c [Thiothrix fructosivorans]MBO0614720.1 type I-C CRISPR-associated protein Cas5 [Thiothrix fructosivorans]QTX09540.1 type I-C CRISPR-associated protein Cas5 [Thiothrix fructosivorans]
MQTFCLEVAGDFACFTRPEMKVERVSYDVITPSAARAVFEAILWKPAIRWHIRKIEVLKPIRWINLRRNEVSGVVPAGAVKSAMKQGKGNLGMYIEEDRQQRAGLFLRDVRYRLHAEFEMLDNNPENNPVKFAEMFKRRASKGQCFNQPYLGTREFSCDFRLVEDETVLTQPLAETRELGWMLYDMDFADTANPMPRFFQAKMQDGVIHVPAWDSEEIRG